MFAVQFLFHFSKKCRIGMISLSLEIELARTNLTLIHLRYEDIGVVAVNRTMSRWLREAKSLGGDNSRTYFMHVTLLDSSLIREFFSLCQENVVFKFFLKFFFVFYFINPLTQDVAILQHTSIFVFYEYFENKW